MIYVLPKHLVLFLLALSVVAPMALAQPAEFNYERLTWQDGVAGNRVHVITQDSLGFMWMGTPEDGLLRYDGYTFTQYIHDPENPASVSSNNIQAVYVDTEGTLWVGAWEGGLDRYDPLTDSFIHYRHDPDDPASVGSNRIRSVLEDRDGNFWVGTFGSGLNKMDRAKGTFTRYPHSAEDPDQPTSLSHSNLRVLYEGRDGRLWLGTAGGGLNRFDPATGLFTTYRNDPASRASLAHDHVYSLYEDRRGALWVGTLGNVLHRMDAGSGFFDRFYYNQMKGEASASTASLGNGAINSMFEDEAGALWITGSQCCLERFEVRSDSLIPHHLPGVLRLSGYSTSFRSQDGTLWFGTIEGLFRVDPAPLPVAFRGVKAPESNEPIVFSLYQDEDGILWMGTEEGLLRRDPVTGAESWFNLGPGKDAKVWSIIHQDQRGILWMGFNDELYSLDRRTGRATQHHYLPPGGGGGAITAIQEDHDGYVWIATFGTGLSRYDPRTDRFEHYQRDPDDPASLSSNGVQNLLVARDGTIWLGMGNGFNRYHPQTNSFTHVVLPLEERVPNVSYDVHALYEDSRGLLWYGTPHGTGGISRFDPRTGRFTRISAEDYLAYSFQEDDHGNLWIATDAGMLLYHAGQETFTMFGPDQGFDAWKIGSMYLGSYKDPAGKLFMGAAGGYYEFHPDDLLAETKTSTPQVALLSLAVNGAPVEHGADAPIPTPIWLTDRVTLAHTQNTFDLTFAALHYRNPETNKLRYRLEGYDAAWREAGPDRTANYVKVPPGTYRFRVQGSVGDGVWERAERSVQLVVLPPWWRTTWAYLLYGVLVLGGVFAVDRVQRRRLLQRERERTMQRELEQKRAIEQAHTELQQAHTHLQTTQAQLIQAEKMASLGQLTAGIAHEIKNPLNFVNNFAGLNVEIVGELLDAVGADPAQPLAAFKEDLADLKINAAKIEEHGRRADGIVQAMMDHARGGEGERRAANVNALVEEYVNLAFHGKRANVPDFNVTIERDYDGSVGEVAMVPQEMGRVLINLLNNAFDAVHARALSQNGPYAPTVTVSTQRVGDQAEIRVADNGPGIPKDFRKKIFEPFFTTKPTGSGTGLGLSLSYDIVTQGHGGTMALESEEGEGAAFVVTLPLTS